MAFDVFRLRDDVVGEYRGYVESFINVRDARIKSYVEEMLDGGELWPDAVLQLNPAYEPGKTLKELASEGRITEETARFFGPEIRLYRHQVEAIGAYLAGEPYVVSTGTGSGKSLTYLIPIVDYVFRNNPADHSVRALIVYPMNALINSQLKALQDFRDRNWPDCPLKFGRYTGQDREEARKQLLTDPPHILLTNYVMLEYMLIRPTDGALLHQATRQLKFLSVDELHVYRGRQGADVAMLMRRVRQRAGRDDLLCIGTSATLVTGESRADTRKKIAEVGSRLFGVEIKPDHVVDETLRRVTSVDAPADSAALRAAVEAPPPASTVDDVARHPLAAWVEVTFGLDVAEDGRLIRRKPVAFEEGLRRLVEETGLPEEKCRKALKAMLDAGNAAEHRAGEPVFAFRLHQFLASGGSVYTTLEAPEARSFSAQGQFYAPREEGKSENRVMFPLAFCRECGQEYYLASRNTGSEGEELLPRSPLLHATDEDLPGDPGFVSLEDGSLWGDEEELPDNFTEMRKSGPRVKKNYEPHVPQRIWVTPEGKASSVQTEGALEAWWQPRPLMVCLRCRAAYDLREGDFRKLLTLSQTGRSTATTILSTGVITSLPEVGFAEMHEPERLLSFTDNRQDASLQAGHTNDFVQVVQLRAALVEALRRAQGHTLTFDALGESIFAALNPDPKHFMVEPVSAGPGYNHARKTMIELLHYLAVEDLARAWRVAQPNLEQTGLLRIEYAGLDDLVVQDGIWTHELFGSLSPEKRKEIVVAVLDHMRSVLVLNDPALAEDATRKLVTRVSETLRDPWSFEEGERLKRGGVASLPGITPPDHDREVVLRLGTRSAIGRYLKSRHTWGIDNNLTSEQVEEVNAFLMEALRGHILQKVERKGQDFGVQIKVSSLLWRLGDGEAPPPDPVRAKSLHLRREDEAKRPANAFFQELYKSGTDALKGLLSGEHTGQVAAERREARELAFNEGNLPVLYCSPTMELGVDIKDLSVVHMRNVPPTPANYAQRSGRAGRGGKPALVLAFSSHGNAHDHYFFQKKEDMIAGAVAPPRIDTANKELIEAHLNSTWLSIVRTNLGSSALDVLDLGGEFPIKEDTWAQLQPSEDTFQEILSAFRAVIASAGEEITDAPWYSESWLEDLAQNAPQRFDRAFDRWRELYRAATKLRDEARKTIDDPRASRKDREAAEQREREAKREIQLLLNEGSHTEQDFYIYRYLAGEGFLPGYNFPRLPLRALVASGNAAQAIDRPRFLGLTEFGPGNTLYHEGRKHRVSSVVMPAGGIEARLSRAKLCNSCGYVHPGQDADVDLCLHCGTKLDGATSQFPQGLFDQPTVRTERRMRITAEEEERIREGYVASTHFRAPGGGGRVARELIAKASEEPILSALYLPHAQLWRINHGWRRSAEQTGFVIDRVSGRWLSKDQAENAAQGGEDNVLSGLKPYVTDFRNILLLRPRVDGAVGEDFLMSLAYALRRAIQIEYQVEEQEVQVEPIGADEHRKLLFWEAAEGGIGVWERLIAEASAFQAVARRALDLLHFDPETGDEQAGWADRCTAACYECLLSYTNQPHHRHLNRHTVRDILLALTTCASAPAAEGPTYDEQYKRLLDLIDPNSSLEKAFLDHLYQNGLRLPDHAQHLPTSDVAVQPDFYYERDGIPGVCVFVDGPHHDAPDQAVKDKHVREALMDQGFRVIAIRHDQDMIGQMASNCDIFTKI